MGFRQANSSHCWCLRGESAEFVVLRNSDSFRDITCHLWLNYGTADPLVKQPRSFYFHIHNFKVGGAKPHGSGWFILMDPLEMGSEATCHSKSGLVLWTI